MINFIVSNYRKLWRMDVSNIFILEPYVLHVLEKDEELNNYSHIDSALAIKRTTKSIEDDDSYITSKYDQYIETLVPRLNAIHDTSYNQKFWRKSMSFGLITHLTMAHRLFSGCEKYFDENRHVCNILSSDSYVVPNDFEEARKLLQYSDFGQEQLFSIYMRCFYPDVAPEVSIDYKSSDLGGKGVPFVNLKGRLLLFFRRLSNLSLNWAALKIINKLKNESDVEVGILGAYFSKKNMEELVIKSRGKINVIPRKNTELCRSSKVNEKLRNRLFRAGSNFDRFDLFFFHTLMCLFPKALLEGFAENVKSIEKKYSSYTSLKYMVSEAWLSSTGHSLVLAIMGAKGVKHIFNEHNVLLYPWAGSMTLQQAELSDVFYTLGWYESGVPNTVKGASLFEFEIDKKKEKTYTAVLFSNVALVKLPEYSSAYAFCADFIPGYVEYMRLFYAAMSLPAKKTLIFRGPRSAHDGLLRYDKEFLLRPYLSQLSNENTDMYTGREVIARSRLIIVDYLATTHLESLRMNVPTVILLNPAINLLKDEYSGFFDALMDVGICQPEPIAAAKFIEKILDDPESWWFSEETQKAKNDFLVQNFGKPSTAINYYLGLLN